MHGKPLTTSEISELWALFGPPPVLSTENQQSYDKIRTAYTEYFRPVNAVELRAVREVVDTDWEIIRFTRHRTVAIERGVSDFRDAKLRALREENARAKNSARQHDERHPGDILGLVSIQAWVDRTESDIEQFLKRDTLEIDYNRAILRGAEFLDHLDGWLNSATARRYAASQLVEYCCAGRPSEAACIETTCQEVEPAAQRPIEHQVEIETPNSTCSAGSSSEATVIDTNCQEAETTTQPQTDQQVETPPPTWVCKHLAPNYIRNPPY